MDQIPSAPQIMAAGAVASILLALYLFVFVMHRVKNVIFEFLRVVVYLLIYKAIMERSNDISQWWHTIVQMVQTAAATSKREL